MPIKPENKKLYPKNWAEIRAKKLDDSFHTCEGCGLPNHVHIIRDPATGAVVRQLRKGWKESANAATDDHKHWEWCEGESWYKVIYVVLTVAHVDHDPTHNAPENLKCFCQQCHNRHDAKHRAETRKRHAPSDK